MTWIKLDDKAPRHPKIAVLSDRAFRWWILALCYASEFLTDGNLPPTFYKQIPTNVRKEMTEAGVWVFDDPDLRIHDYLEHQTSRRAVEDERRRNRDRRNNDAGRTAVPTPPDDTGRTNKRPRPDTEVEIRDQKPDHNTHTARANGHGNGANAPGSLPRDHRFHAICGPNWRVCLTEATAAKLSATWGGSPDDAMATLREFTGWLERKIGDGPKGDHLWLVQHFESFMAEQGRAPIAAMKPAAAKKTTAEIVAEVNAMPKGIGR